MNRTAVLLRHYSPVNSLYELIILIATKNLMKSKNHRYSIHI